MTVAVVTGAGSGIGAATARRLASDGMHVAVADVDPERAADVAGRIAASGGRALAVHVDVADEDSVRECVASVRAQWGAVSVLHNNAAATDLSGTADGDVLAMTTAVWDRTMAVNLRGPMLMCREVLPDMLAARRGTIVNTSSGAARVAEHTRVAYGASKAALEALTRSVATRYGPEGIRCNAVAPGLTLTDTVTGPGRGVAKLRQIMQRHAPSPLGTPEEVAAVVAFLVSDDARYINGVVLTVDGGLLAAQPYLADFLGR